MMTTESLKQSMDLAVKHYASLFRLPSYWRVILLQVLICVGGGVLTVILLFPNAEGFFNGVLLGSSLFLVNLLIDYVVGKVLMRQDEIYDLRRTATLSLFCWGLWLFFILIGDIATLLSLNPSWWVRLCLLGFSAVLIFRSIVFNSTSAKNYGRLVLPTVLQPFVCIAPFILVWARIGYPVSYPMFLFLGFALAVSIVSSYSFISLINRVGKQSLGVPSLTFFKAFLLNWIVGLNAPFEELLEKLGEEQSVKLSLIKFDSSRPKAAFMVPSVHPGPFKNVGSSTLPSMLKSAVESECGCVACVPHGLFGHELDLASQTQNQRVIDQVVRAMSFKASDAKASPFVTVNNGLATACCQIFGNSAFLSVTLAPKTTEDFPQELGMFARQEAERLGLACCVVVNAHNSIDQTNGMPDEALDSLKTVAADCLEKAVAMKQVPFQVGAATILPKEFGLEEGMGKGGITVILIKVGDQKTAYVVIDGNNAVSGLREKVLSALYSIGVDAGELYTSDTHSVNALILGERGYNPLGAATDHDKLIAYIKEVALAALSNLETVKTGCRSITVDNVKVIGEERLEALSLLTDEGLRQARRIVAAISCVSGLLLMLFLLFV
jgi:putative membrane protein